MRIIAECHPETRHRRSRATVLKTATVGMLLAAQGTAGGALAPRRETVPALPSPHDARPGRWAAPPAAAPWQPTVGVEFEVFGNDATTIDGIVQSAGVRTAPPWQLSRREAVRLWLGQGVPVPDKGRDIGSWRVVPELAFPLDTHEVVSPALAGRSVHAVHDVAEALTRAGRRTPGDGAFHVHVGHAGLDAGALADLTRLWDRHHPLLFALSNTDVRQRQLYARPPEAALTAALRLRPPATLAQLHALYIETHAPLPRLSLADEARRFYALNLHYLATGATVEFRAYQFIDRPQPEMAMAYVDLSVAMMAAARDGIAARLAAMPSHPERDAAWLLEALAVPVRSRAVLLANSARSHGFACFDGEVRTALWESVSGVMGGALFAATHARPGRTPATLRWFAEGMMLTSVLHVGAFVAEASGVSTYVATYAAREWTVLHFLRIGLGLRAVAAFF